MFRIKKNKSIQGLYFKDTSFASLMTRRIYNVLLVASNYDAFVLEEDGRIDEQLFNEYHALNLRYPPRFTLTSSHDEAHKLLTERHFDLIILMPNSDSSDSFEEAKKIKFLFPSIPIVVLTPFSREVSIRLASEDLSAIDYVFSWLGNADLLLAIIKLIEDSMNVEDDVQSVGVQIILVIEDSVRFYSSYLPNIYKFVFKQSLGFMTEALNEHQMMLRMRGRPKVMLARNYEEAIELYNKYENNIMGVISDVSFNRYGKKDSEAGIKLCTYFRQRKNFLPIIIQSSEADNIEKAKAIGATFINKNSKKIDVELREAILNEFGFDDLVFYNAEGHEIERIKNLRDLQYRIFEVSSEQLFDLLSQNKLSRWLYSRAMFPLAEFLKGFTIKDMDQLPEARQLIFDAIVKYRKIKNRGIIAIFKRDRFDQYSNFARIGDGSLGGKGRGLAFLDAMLKRNESELDYENLHIAIPKTIVLCTEIFSSFMATNNLYPVALSEASDEEILTEFLNASLPSDLIDDLEVFLSTISTPIAIRSSSLLEDSHYQPFAGIYSTYMVPSSTSNKSQTLKLVCESIKGVYASVFYRDSKAYMTATRNVIDQEKMAIVLQEVVGTNYNNTRYYPSLSGVARSLNFYPIGAEHPEDGVANIALGLGKHIVDGGVTLRFSPSHPHNILQTSTLDLALRETQTNFKSIDLTNFNSRVEVNDGFNLLHLNVKEAESDGSLKYIASTFDHYDQVLNDGVYPNGRKVITFANVLQHEVFPLAKSLETILKICQKEIGRAIEIEFAVNIDDKNNEDNIFYLLQIRPIVENKEILKEDISTIQNKDTIISAKSALGNAIMNDIQDIVYVKQEMFSASKNQLIAYDIEKVNKAMQAENRHYIIVGPGRWGSSDHWLGIPVKWPQIANARVIVECGLENYRIEPSQGTHFFQNLTSFGVGYFTINPFINDGYFDIDYLNSLPAETETQYIRHVRFEKPVVVKIDGKHNLGVILK